MHFCKMVTVCLKTARWLIDASQNCPLWQSLCFDPHSHCSCNLWLANSKSPSFCVKASTFLCFRQTQKSMTVWSGQTKTFLPTNHFMVHVPKTNDGWTEEERHRTFSKKHMLPKLRMIWMSGLQNMSCFMEMTIFSSFLKPIVALRKHSHCHIFSCRNQQASLWKISSLFIVPWLKMFTNRLLFGMFSEIWKCKCPGLSFIFCNMKHEGDIQRFWKDSVEHNCTMSVTSTTLSQTKWFNPIKMAFRWVQVLSQSHQTVLPFVLAVLLPKETLNRESSKLSPKLRGEFQNALWTLLWLRGETLPDSRESFERKQKSVTILSCWTTLPWNYPLIQGRVLNSPLW